MERVLVVQHVPHEGPGRIVKFAAEEGVKLDVVEAWHQKVDADPAAFHDGLIIMGGPMSANDLGAKFPTKLDEWGLIEAYHRRRIPILGICLGSQLIAGALGANVVPNKKDGLLVKEIGFYDVNLKPAAKKDPLFKDLPNPLKVLQWHGEAFRMPTSSLVLATGDLCRYQAFRVGNSWGTLFHLEMTPETIKQLMEIDRSWTHQDFDLDEEDLMKKAAELEPQMQKNDELLIGGFFDFIRSIKQT